MSIAPYRKAIAAFIATAATTAGGAILISSGGGTTITSTEWIGIIVTTLATTLGVFLAPNEPEGQPEA